MSSEKLMLHTGDFLWELVLKREIVQQRIDKELGEKKKWKSPDEKKLNWKGFGDGKAEGNESALIEKWHT